MRLRGDTRAAVRQHVRRYAVRAGLSLPRGAHNDNIVTISLERLPGVTRPSHLVGMINTSIEHAPATQMYAF